MYSIIKPIQFRHFIRWFTDTKYIWSSYLSIYDFVDINCRRTFCTAACSMKTVSRLSFMRLPNPAFYRANAKLCCRNEKNGWKNISIRRVWKDCTFGVTCYILKNTSQYFIQIQLVHLNECKTLKVCFVSMNDKWIVFNTTSNTYARTR